MAPARTKARDRASIGANAIFFCGKTTISNQSAILMILEALVGYL